jgi:hypothetical protein
LLLLPERALAWRKDMVSFVMRRLWKAVAVMALAGTCTAATAAPPALAAKPSSSYTHHKSAHVSGTPARYASRLYACNGGRYYTYLGGWGCDYYLYPELYAPRRR